MSKRWVVNCNFLSYIHQFSNQSSIKQYDCPPGCSEHIKEINCCCCCCCCFVTIATISAHAILTTPPPPLFYSYPPHPSHPSSRFQFLVFLLQSLHVFRVPPHISQVVFRGVSQLADPYCCLKNSRINLLVDIQSCVFICKAYWQIKTNNQELELWHNLGEKIRVQTL